MWRAQLVGCTQPLMQSGSLRGRQGQLSMWLLPMSLRGMRPHHVVSMSGDVDWKVDGSRASGVQKCRAGVGTVNSDVSVMQAYAGVLSVNL